MEYVQNTILTPIFYSNKYVAVVLLFSSKCPIDLFFNDFNLICNYSGIHEGEEDTCRLCKKENVFLKQRRKDDTPLYRREDALKLAWKDNALDLSEMDNTLHLPKKADVFNSPGTANMPYPSVLRGKQLDCPSDGHWDVVGTTS